MVNETKPTKISFNGSTLLTALEDAKISPENFFGKNIPTIKELKQEIENDVWFVMHPFQMVEISAQQFKLVHPIGSGGDNN